MKENKKNQPFYETDPAKVAFKVYVLLFYSLLSHRETQISARHAAQHELH